MTAILVRAGCFVAIIAMGIILRKVGFFKESDFHVLSKIVIKITLTCAIITNFSGREIAPSLFIVTLIGFTFCVAMMAVSYLLARHKGKREAAFSVVNVGGCNIGNFALPFAQSFLGPMGVMAACLFDVGNVFICLGGSYGVAQAIQGPDGSEPPKSFSMVPIFKSLAHSLPFLTYVIMTILCLCHITLPDPITEFAGICGSSNTFLAMLMIGVGFKFSSGGDQKGTLIRLLIIKYGMGIAAAFAAFYLLPLPMEYRKAIVLLFLSPVASAAPVYTAQLKNDFGLASAVNSFSIIISIVLMTGALLLMV